jgi:hypothetical protein
MPREIGAGELNATVVLEPVWLEGPSITLGKLADNGILPSEGHDL